VHHPRARPGGHEGPHRGGLTQANLCGAWLQARAARERLVGWRGPGRRFLAASGWGHAGQAGTTYAIAVAAWGSEGQELARYCPAEVVAVPFTPGLAGMVLAGVAGPAAYALLRRRGR
jgi:hypothetical protein